MRVLYFTINRKTFGTARILTEWITLGPEHGIEPCVVTVADDDLAQWCRTQGVPVMANPLPDTQWKNLPAHQWHLWRTLRFARQNKIQLVHCNEHNCYPFAVRVAQTLGIPIVCHMRYRPEREWVQWVMTGQRAPQAMLWTSQTQKANSAQAVQGLIPAERQHVIRLGLNTDRFGDHAETRAATRAAWGYHDDDIVLGYSAVLQERKRVEDFLNLVQALSAENPRVAGVLAGHTKPEFASYTDAILKEIESRGLGDRFQWLGRVDPIEPMLQGIDLFVSTSEYETFGMSVAEAMVCRKPVLVYEGGSLREVVDTAGVVIDTADTDALLHEGRALVDDRQRRAALGQAGRERMDELFNPKSTVQALVQVYRDVLTQAKAKPATGGGQHESAE